MEDTSSGLCWDDMQWMLGDINLQRNDFVYEYVGCYV
jgi:hypothetical protein